MRRLPAFQVRLSNVSRHHEGSKCCVLRQDASLRQSSASQVRLVKQVFLTSRSACLWPQCATGLSQPPSTHALRSRAALSSAGVPVLRRCHGISCLRGWCKGNNQGTLLPACSCGGPSGRIPGSAGGLAVSRAGANETANKLRQRCSSLCFLLAILCLDIAGMQLHAATRSRFQPRPTHPSSLTTKNRCVQCRSGGTATVDPVALAASTDEPEAAAAEEGRITITDMPGTSGEQSMSQPSSTLQQEPCCTLFAAGRLHWGYSSTQAAPL